MKRIDYDTRIAVTGIGIVCSVGANASEVWESISEGRDGIVELSKFPGEEFPTSIAAEVGDVPLDPSVCTSRDLRRFSRTDRMAVAAALQALAQADDADHPLSRERLVVSTGTSTGGLLEGEDWYFKRRKSPTGAASVREVLQQPTSGPSDAVATVLDAGGGVVSNATACASGGAAIGFAADFLRSGRADAAVAGGSDALCRLTYSGFNVLQAVDENKCRPFDEARGGISLGEGAGYVVLERWVDAEKRGAVILAEFLGYGASCDAHHPTAPIEDGRGAASAMSEALRTGGCNPAQVSYVNAHGTGTPLNDPAESAAIRTVVGVDTPVSSPKSFFGHTLGAAGGLEAVVSVLALLNQEIPPTLRLEEVDPDCELRHVRGSNLATDVDMILSNTFGFGGSNVSLLFRRADTK